jgi:hypothetical protein
MNIENGHAKLLRLLIGRLTNRAEKLLPHTFSRQ